MPYARGESHCKATLTDKQCKQIRREYIPFVATLSDLGRRYGVTRATIAGIVAGRRRAAK